MYHPTDSAALRCLRKDGDDPCLFILFLHMCNMKMPKSTYVAWCKYTVMIHVYGMNQCIYPLKKNWWFNKKMFIDNSIQTIACVFSNQDSSEVGLPGTKGRYQTPSNPWASAMVLTWSSDHNSVPHGKPKDILTDFPRQIHELHHDFREIEAPNPSTHHITSHPWSWQPHGRLSCKEQVATSNKKQARHVVAYQT